MLCLSFLSAGLTRLGPRFSTLGQRTAPAAASDPTDPTDPTDPACHSRQPARPFFKRAHLSNGNAH
jgi:hypothetical protein